jgi:hypothetical protein
MEIEPRRPKRRRQGAASDQSDGSEPDPTREEDFDGTNNESAITVGGAPYTVEPRARPCQRAALEAYALNHAKPRGKIVMACGTGKLAMGDTAILVEQITAMAARLWEERLAELVAFKAMPEHGHCNVPQRYEANPQLGKWVHTQRAQKTKCAADPAASQLTVERVAKLEALGFAWDLSPVAWEERLAELATFKAMPEHGHCIVPEGYPENKQLGKWVTRQRNQKTKYDADPTTSQLTPERVAKLEALGFAWDPRAAAWEEKLRQLVAFKAMPAHDHCNVPRGYPANPQLGEWVSRQRQQKKKYDAYPATSQLTAERVAKLEVLGFAWDPFSAAWEEKMEELATFQAMPGHGHCNVPKRYLANPQLGFWVNTQRKQKTKYDAEPATSWITAKRVARLEALGFAWGPLAAAWEEKLAELETFKAMLGHGHCNVPRGYLANPQLGKWVDRQRQQKKKYDADPVTSWLTAERVAKLEALGFAWSRW